MTTEQSIDINCGIADTFTFTTEHVAEWSQTVVSDEVIEERPGGVGTRFRCTTEERGSRMVFEGVVTHHEPPRRQSSRLTGPHFDIDVDYQFTEVGDATRVTQRSVVYPKGALKVIFFLFGWMMKGAGRKALQKDLQSLKQLLEARRQPSAA